MPAPLRTGTPLREETVVWSLTELGRREALAQLKPRAVRLRAIVEALARARRDDGGRSSERDREHTGCPAQTRSTRLRRAGEARCPLAKPATPAARSGPPLNDAQREAVQRISGTLGSFASHLLYGVTGSGKTEVYLRAIAAVIERGEQALVLVPEIALTPQLIARFRARFDAPLAVLHSNLSDGERLAAWRSAARGPRQHRHRHALGGVQSARATRADRRRRRARRVVQAAGRLPLLGARPRDRARAAARDSGRARLGDAVAGKPASRATPAAVAVAAAAARGATRSRRAWR